MVKQKTIVGTIKNDEHKKLLIEKQRLQRLESLGYITEKELKVKLRALDERINFNIQHYIEELKEKDIVKEVVKEEKIKMAEEKKTQEKPKRVTNTDIIIDLLQRKGLKTTAEVVEKFKEKKPDANEKNVKQQVTEIIGWVKKGHKKFASYTWDSEAYLLTVKE